MKQAWFCYVLIHGYIPAPRIYYDILPLDKYIDRVQLTNVSDLAERTPKHFTLDLLAAMYPYIPPLKEESSDATIATKEKQMTRPVTGFQTSQGNFFETEAEANLFEASYELHEATTTAVHNFEPRPADDQSFEDSLVEGIKAFIASHERIIRKYLDARATLTPKGLSDTVSVDGPPAKADPSNDPSVRSKDNPRLDEKATTKGKPT